MKAVIYSRVSTEDQNPESQLQVIIDYARGKGYEISNVFQENISGSINPFDRPIFKKLLHYIGSNDVDILLLHDLTRFYRPPPGQVSKALSIMREIIDRYNVLIEFVSEPQIDDPMLSELWKFLKSWISAYERLQISIRTRYGLLRIRREGKLYHKPDLVYYYAAWINEKDVGEVTREEYELARRQLKRIVEKYWFDNNFKRTRIADILAKNELKELYIRYPYAPKSYLTFYRLMSGKGNRMIH